MDINIQMREMYLGGMGLPGIALSIGRSQCFVHYRLKKIGVALRKPGNPKKIRMERRVDQSELDKAVGRYLKGESAKSIGESAEISKPTLLRELKRLGIAVRMQATGNDVDIIAAYLSGMSTNEIERKIGCTKRRASNVLKAAGIEFRERTREKTSLSRSLACKRRSDAVAITTPAWADKEKIRLIYMKCREISKLTGTAHHVDHFYPLRHTLVCGLHVPENLSIITERQNVAKKNKIEDVFLEWSYAK